MAEALVKDREVLDARIKGLLTGFSPILEMFDCAGIQGVARSDLQLPLVAFVANHPLAGRDLAFEPVWLSINLEITLPRRKGSIDPNQPIFI